MKSLNVTLFLILFLEGCIGSTSSCQRKTNTAVSLDPSYFVEKSTQLPQDPGRAGKRDLNGIDADEDGLRDDIQIAVHHAAPNDKKIRTALRHILISMTAAMSNSKDTRTSVQNTDSFLDGLACLEAIMGTDKSHRLLEDLRAVVVNTYERGIAEKKWYANNHHRDFSTVPPESSDCTINLERFAKD